MAPLVGPTARLTQADHTSCDPGASCQTPQRQVFDGPPSKLGHRKHDLRHELPNDDEVGDGDAKALSPGKRIACRISALSIVKTLSQQRLTLTAMAASNHLAPLGMVALATVKKLCFLPPIVLAQAHTSSKPAADIAPHRSTRKIPGRRPTYLNAPGVASIPVPSTVLARFAVDESSDAWPALLRLRDRDRDWAWMRTSLAAAFVAAEAIVSCR